MAKEINNAEINLLNARLPAHRQGPLGDAQKVNCATCHQGAYQPLLGANMLADYPNLGALAPAPEAAPEAMEEAPPMEMETSSLEQGAGAGEAH